MPDFPIVDSHVHLLEPETLGYAWTKNAPSLNRRVLPADLYATAKPVEIEAFVFVEVDVDAPKHVAEAEWVQSLADRDPRLKGIVASLPLERGKGVEADLERMAKLRNLRAIRRLIQDQPDPDFCTKPAFVEGVKLLAAHDLVFDICIYHHQLPAVIRLVEQCPEVRFVLDHIGKPGIRAGLMEPWATHMRDLATLPNVACKISGVATEADHKAWTREGLRPFIDHAIETFGFDRALFGSDWHVADLAIGYADWVALVDEAVAGASAEDKRKLFRDNAVREYRLKM